MIAQNIAGVYSMRSGSPEGGSNLVVLENGKYVIFYFGGAQIGYWKNTADNKILFTPHKEESSFQVYGRKNNLLKNTIKIAFFGFENGSTLINSNTSKRALFTKVFNDDANCFGPLHSKIFNTITKEIRFAARQEMAGLEVVSFSTKGYNDFIAYYIPSTYLDSFTGVFKENKLYFDDTEGVVRKDLPEEGEDILYVRDLANSIDKIEEIKYCNPQYNYFEDEIPAYYEFDRRKEAYIDHDQYKEGQELNLEEYDYDDMSIIYKYKRCSPNVLNIPEIEIDGNSVFIEKCD